MSDNDRSDVRAYKELETLVRHLGEELASFRRRAIAAEAQLRDSGQTPRAQTAVEGQDLAMENDQLRSRLTRAEERVRQMLDRMRFLRQQLQAQSTAGAGRS